MNSYRSKPIAYGALGLLLAGAIISTPPAQAESPVFLLAETEGKVEVQGLQNVSWQTAHRGMVLHPGNVIRTGARSKAEMRMPAGTFTLYENTILEIPADYIQTRVSDRPESLQKVILEKGWALFHILKNKLRGGFEVVTPSLIAGVKGTTFEVIESDDLRAVLVTEGIVEVARRDLPDEIIEIRELQYTLFMDDSLSEAREFQGEEGRSLTLEDLTEVLSLTMEGAEEGEIRDELTAIQSEIQEEGRELADVIRNEARELADVIRNEARELVSDLREEKEDLKDEIVPSDFVGDLGGEPDPSDFVDNLGGEPDPSDFVDNLGGGKP